MIQHFNFQLLLLPILIYVGSLTLPRAAWSFTEGCCAYYFPEELGWAVCAEEVRYNCDDGPGGLSGPLYCKYVIQHESELGVARTCEDTLECPEEGFDVRFELILGNSGCPPDPYSPPWWCVPIGAEPEPCTFFDPEEDDCLESCAEAGCCE